MRSVLLAGISTRAAADSAVAAGFAVTAIDAFGDIDVHPDVRVVTLPPDTGAPFSARAAADAASRYPTDAAAYLANFENDPAAVEALAANRMLWGNSPDVVRHARDPLEAARAFRESGISVPHVCIGPRADDEARNRTDVHAWLLKPMSSGGGHGVRPWSGEPVPRNWYLQQRLEGVPASVVFVAANGGAVTLGFSRQLIGEADFGAAGFRYCGSILAPAGDEAFADEPAMEAAHLVAASAAASFGLVGVNGIDVVATAGGTLYPVEVNPRWSGSMELVERAYGLCVFAIHAAACAWSKLPDFDVRAARREARAVGKAILFAREDVTMGDTRRWLEDRSVRDVPQPGTEISAGRPICTIFAEAGDAGGCRRALVQRAERVYAAIAARATLD